MRKYLLHILIISFVFLLAPTAQVASYAGVDDPLSLETAKEEVRKNPDDAGAHNNLGAAYGKSGKYEEAIESYKQAIRIDPDYADARYNLGYTYVLLNDKASALEQYKILKKLDTELANKLFDEINK
jgi:tetratricopeptide (TPR) repeat protein